MSKSSGSDQPTIPPAVSKQLVANHGGKTSTSKRVSPEAAEAISEALRLFVCHAHRRASIEVSLEILCSFLVRESWHCVTTVAIPKSQQDACVQQHALTRERFSTLLNKTHNIISGVVLSLNRQAECDDEEEFKSMNEGKHSESGHTPIDAHHVTRIAGDLLMDFS